MSEIREQLGDLNIKVLGKVNHGLELTVLPILARVVSEVFDGDQRKELYLDLNIHKNLSFEKTPTDVQLDFPKEDESYTINIQVQSYGPGQTNVMLLDIYTLLSMNLIMAKYHMDGRLAYENEKEYFDGVDVTDKDTSELPYVIEALKQVDEVIDEFITWTQKTMRHLN